MRENRPYGSEGGESGSTRLPYPYLIERYCVKRQAVGGVVHAVRGVLRIHRDDVWVSRNRGHPAVDTWRRDVRRAQSRSQACH
jgi:hypothetical protein